MCSRFEEKREKKATGFSYFAVREIENLMFFTPGWFYRGRPDGVDALFFSWLPAGCRLLDFLLISASVIFLQFQLLD